VKKNENLVKSQIIFKKIWWIEKKMLIL